VLGTFGPIALFLVVAVIFPIIPLLLSRFLAPHRPNPVKLEPYESGMDPIHDTRRRFDVRFHLVAIAFLVFDVELLFLYPWAVIYRDAANGPSGMFLFGEMLVFIGLLGVGYVYVWKKKAFDWK